MSLHIETPLVASRPLSLASGLDIWLKLDALQPSGSFKLRGIGAACEAYAKQGKRRFVSSSGGNAGIAVAVAGRILGLPVTVVVPETTTEAGQATDSPGTGRGDRARQGLARGQCPGAVADGRGRRLYPSVR